MYTFRSFFYQFELTVFVICELRIPSKTSEVQNCHFIFTSSVSLTEFILWREGAFLSHGRSVWTHLSVQTMPSLRRGSCPRGLVFVITFKEFLLCKWILLKPRLFRSSIVGALFFSRSGTRRELQLPSIPTVKL